MIRLEQFYDLISRNAQVTLTNSRRDKTYFDGNARDIPDEYGTCEVTDFNMQDSGKIIFRIKVQNTRPEGSNWQEGALRVHESTFHFWVKVYDKGSKYGIDGGRVSKLMLKRDGLIVCNYDRGWDVKPVDEDTELAKDIVLHQYTL